MIGIGGLQGFIVLLEMLPIVAAPLPKMLPF